ncbi:MAG: class I SAM-dependent methyltransferase [Planctomycetota bacterium]|jgi:SAM-dependent methyltransferase
MRLHKRVALFVRGLLFFGLRYRCPCCGWRCRAFAGEWGLLATKPDGYCPRCNSKARHRRLWIYLRDRTNLFSDRLRLLEVAPWWSLTRRFRRMRNLRFVGLDIARRGDSCTLLGDVTAMPLGDDTVDAALCIHTLEHVEDDRRAIAELYRVLRPGGWSVVSVPLRLDAPTYEDPAITRPEERERAFGERGHVRWYGTDFVNRLKAAGFLVEMDPGVPLPRCGIRDDENLFLCRKPDVPM